jgi:xanthine dehydrogenase YagS FAD-binding subunit
MNRFEWAEAKTISEAIGSLASGAVVKAGGVDVIDRLKEGLESPKRIVNIRNVKGLDYVREDRATGVLRIGPLITLDQLDKNPIVRRKFTALADAAGKAATPQIRNVATLGGNLLQRPRCWYFRNELFNCRKKGGTRCFAQDGENEYHAIFDNRTCAIVHPSAAATALVAFGAKIEITGAKGKREVLLEEFFTSPEDDVAKENSLEPDELITEVRVPLPKASVKSAYIKQGEKESFDWPVADVAVVLDCAGKSCAKASIVLGAAAPVPYRAKEAEAALRGQTISEKTARSAAKAALDNATPLAENSYKIPVFEAIIRRTILKAIGGTA